MICNLYEDLFFDNKKKKFNEVKAMEDFVEVLLKL